MNSTASYTFVIALFWAAGLLQACKAPKAGSSTAPKTIRYEHYSTYSWGKPLIVSSLNPVFSLSQFNQRIRRELAFGFPTRGLDPADDRGDVIIYYYAIVQPVSDAPLLPYHVGWAAEPFINAGERFDRYPANTFVIDVVDSNTEELVWRGSTTLPYNDPDQLYRVLPQRLKELVQRFPSTPSS